MKKYIFRATVILIFLVIGVLFYLSRPFTKSKEIDFFAELPEGIEEEKRTKIQKLKEKGTMDSIFVIQDGKVIVKEGKTEEISNVASVRKSLISALYGIAMDKGLIDITKSLSDLQIDDEVNPLTETEKTATIEDLLKARSGIYLYSLGESQQMKEKRPERGAHLPGEYYYYNNWDFNTLGLIFEQETGKTIGEAFEKWIAEPLEMRKFSADCVIYETSDQTSIPMYRFYMCAEDLARFGYLYANHGVWNGKQVISPLWIEKSLKEYSQTEGEFQGYGYLWWLDKNQDLAWAVGSGGQYIVVDRKENCSYAIMNQTGNSPFGVFWFRTFVHDEVTYQDVREVIDVFS